MTKMPERHQHSLLCEFGSTALEGAARGKPSAWSSQGGLWGPSQPGKQSGFKHEAPRNPLSRGCKGRSPTFAWAHPHGKLGGQSRPPTSNGCPRPPPPHGLRSPPHHRRAARPTSPQPARAPAPTLVTEETPQLGKYQAHAWPRLAAEPPGHPGLSQAAVVSPRFPSGGRSPQRPRASGRVGEQNGAGNRRSPPRPTAARREGPAQRPHGCGVASLCASSCTPTLGELSGCGSCGGRGRLGRCLAGPSCEAGPGFPQGR